MKARHERSTVQVADMRSQCSLRAQYALQDQFHENRSWRRIVPIGVDTLEAQRLVQRDGLFHGGKCIEAHPLVADTHRRINDARSSVSSHTLSPKAPADVEALHLANASA